ncbi:helix-turn-helix domain-containing protein [Azospirillum picis]|uniref:Biotin operon repressor n=1 Tax=Azospirillum picis TaxID=488438 RepID=A0ABU0MP90_9PROT|nr:helix-turn-helix domain-containing protein [Azospirillum picis]MBP2301761.1 biotin operon repressor [Azospirillum picis]MDQ0535064.1 biotin operon repressor [Azospirillum picis]
MPTIPRDPRRASRPASQPVSSPARRPAHPSGAGSAGKPATQDAKPYDARRWGRIPAWWLEHPDLDADGFAVLAALATFADDQGLCWPSQSTLAAKLKRSRPTINRIIQTLGDLGLVSVEHRRGRDGARLSCLYRLRFTPDGATPDGATPDGATPEDAAAELAADAAGLRPVQAADRDDSQAYTPCPQPSQEQVHSEQIPDSHASGGHGPATDGAAREVPADWMPNAADLAWAGSRHAGIDLGRHVEGFVLRCRAHGYRYRDVSAAWRAWLIQDAAAGKAPPQPAGMPPSFQRDATPAAALKATPPRPQAAADQRLGAWAAAAAELRRRTFASPL